MTNDEAKLLELLNLALEEAKFRMTSFDYKRTVQIIDRQFEHDFDQKWSEISEGPY
ncbi:MAG: hypothetical protein GY721_01480 [Deltaproteobacteria bacterium]|nr:hypothetical protein [Deltaproteobacteria bacterium]